MADAVIVLQARTGSRRLPGKVLARIGPHSMLAHCLRRLAVADLPIVVATTSLPEDDRVQREAERCGARVFRGAVDDVLDRCIGAAHANGAREIVRATADNPFVDGSGTRRILDLMRRVRADHVMESGLPVGAAVEAVTLAALERARAAITDPYDREHVTSFVRRAPGFFALRVVSPGHLRRPGLRLTVDTPEDLDFARAIVARLPDETTPGLADIIAVADGLLVPTVSRRQTRQG